MTILSDDVLKETIEAYERQGSIRGAARELGIANSTAQDRIARATSRGIGTHFLSAVPNAPGLELSGVSTLVDATGKPKLQWVKARYSSPDITIAAIKDAFSEWDNGIPTTPNWPKLEASRLITVYPIADLHFGMYTWKEETGASYDTDIASRVLTQSFSELIGRSIPSDLGVVLNLGDWYHSDNDENKTRKSGNKLDVDTRFARVLREGVKLFISVVAMAKQQHKLLLIKTIPGNHDPYGALALTTALDAYYANDERVIVDTQADPIWVKRFGKVLISAMHGDMLKPTEMPGTIASRHAEDWGKSDWRYGYVGHTHQRRVWKADGFERGGMEVEVFRTLAPKDAWQTQMGFVARRSLVGITHDNERGEVHRATVNVK